MPISIKKYVDIKSSTNTTRTATEKELIARIFTKSIFNANQVLEYTNDEIDDIQEEFGNDSVEYKIAQRYFAFINKYSRSPKKISFSCDWRDGRKSTVGSREADTVANLKLITAGAIKITFGQTSKTLTSIDLSSATSYSDIATVIQTAIRASAGDNEDIFANAVCSAHDNSFGITVGTIGREDIKIEPANDSDLCDKLGFNDYWFIEGRPEGSMTDVFDDSYQMSNNFATFTFIDNLSEYGTVQLNVNDVKELGEHINIKYPSEFMFVVPVIGFNKEDMQSAVANINGISLELCDYDNSAYNFVLPMSITATTDYNKENGTVNYMYTQDNNMSVVVDDDNNAKENDELKINYYGRTQQAGQKLAFYQNGVLQGNYQDQSIYVNEIWLKDALTTKFINYMLLTSNWYANKAGQAIGQGLIIDVIDRAKLNGTITTEKEISEADKVYIYNITSDENAWRQIYEQGYYLITKIEKVEINNQQTYQFTYTLLYSKGDSIKKVEGQNILI